MLSSINGLAQSLEAKLGVGPGFAQVLTWLAVLATCWALVQLLMQVMSGGASQMIRRQRGQALLLLGQCGAGKTMLFHQFKDQMEVKTVSSLKNNRESLKIQAGDDILGPIDTIDCPGHQRLRGKQAELMKEARCIVYLVDSEDKQKLKDVAEHLYEILTDQEVIELHIPILLACNKSDLSTARTEKFIVEEIEREIEQMRKSRGATLEGQDQADSYLGVDGEKFKLIEHSPCPIEVCRISAKKPLLEPLFDFLRQQFTS
mmetsp:Transcript_119870/g.220481  ORF Transcript_119870/g.220481 Transcript_119870/m.220481 type:complete len:260 (-) Transcript_119870:70-849(-)